MKVSTLSNAASPDCVTLKLPQEFLAILPTNCVCGAELEINETLTKLYCPNPSCITKVTQRLADMLKQIGVLGMGEARCRQFLEKLRIYNPYVIFAWNMNDADRLAPEFSRDFLQNIYNQLADHRSFTLAEFVKIGFLPDIQDNAFKIFKDYDDLQTFYNDFDTKGTAMIANLLGLQEGSATVAAVCKSLADYRKDLLLGVQTVNIKKNITTLNICISTAVGAPFKSKQDFVSQMNAKYGAKIHLNWLSSVTQKGCDYLICADKNAGTNKVTKAIKYGVPIISGKDFEAMIAAL